MTYPTSNVPRAVTILSVYLVVGWAIIVLGMLAVYFVAQLVVWAAGLVSSRVWIVAGFGAGTIWAVLSWLVEDWE